MHARESEHILLDRCRQIARGATSEAGDRKEANVFRLAAMVLQSRLPAEAASLMRASEAYFVVHPDDRLPAAAVVRHGWIASLPRLRDMLSLELRTR